MHSEYAFQHYCTELYVAWGIVLLGRFAIGEWVSLL